MSQYGEPWVFREQEDSWEDPKKAEVVRATGIWKTVMCNTTYYPTAVDPKNMQRITLCVNAFAGIPDEEIEHFARMITLATGRPT